MRRDRVRLNVAVILCIGPLCGTFAAAADEPQAMDFSIRVAGPSRVYQGHGLRLAVSARALTEAREIIALTVEDLPPQAEPAFELWQDNRFYHEGSGVVAIRAGEQTPPGDYQIRIVARSQRSGVERTATAAITVLPAPQPLPRQVVADNPPIPLLERWEQQMVDFGRRHADSERIAQQGVWEGGVWYYDGQRVFYQIADYTDDPSWIVAAGDVQRSYRDGYVLPNEGRVPGWRIFPHGLAESYRRDRDEQSKQAVILMSRNAAFANRGGGVSTALSRETAYCLMAYLVAEELGEPRSPQLAKAVDNALGHIDQWFITRNFREVAPEDSLAPFMVGLTAEALIGYYEKTQDPRVPHAIKAAADGLWELAWVEADEAFWYRREDPYTPPAEPLKGAPDLNLMIAPLYAWLYQHTGEAVYQQRGDAVFAGGVKGAYLGGGKMFSQNYRWSFDYVRWRQNPPVQGQ